MQLLAGLGADTTLPPFYICTPTKNNRRVVGQRYLPTDAEHNVSCCAKDFFGVCTNFVSDRTPLQLPRPHSTMSDMNSILREITVDTTGKTCSTGVRSNTTQDHTTSSCKKLREITVDTTEKNCSTGVRNNVTQDHTTSYCERHKGAACSCDVSSSSPHSQLTRERIPAGARGVRQQPMVRDTSKPMARDTSKPAARDSSKPMARDTRDPGSKLETQPQEHLLLPVEPTDPVSTYKPQSSPGTTGLIPREPSISPHIPGGGGLMGDQVVNPEVRREPREVARDQRRSGARVLCLSGGGLRGLVELEMLRQVEEVLQENGQSITSFFDYIVGTSTGAIIALALVYGRS